MVPVTAAGLALALYTKNIPFGFYMASIMLGSCSVVNYYSREIKNDIALNMQRASAPLVVPLRFPYKVLVTAAPDERSVEMRQCSCADRGGISVCAFGWRAEGWAKSFSAQSPYGYRYPDTFTG